MNKEYRKGAVDLTDLAIGIVVLGIVVTIGATILVNVRNSQTSSLPTYTVVAESVTPTDAGVDLAKTWGVAVTACNNNTAAGAVINSGNYTTSVDSSNGLITITNTSSQWIDKAWACNYTVGNISDPRYSLADDAATGLGEYGNWFKIIVIVGVAAVILALIFMAFGGRNSSSGGGIGGSY